MRENTETRCKRTNFSRLIRKRFYRIERQRIKR